MGDYTVGFKTNSPGAAWSGTLDVDNTRRTFGISDKVVQLNPKMSPFFTYLSRVAKVPGDETVWKPLEYRPQWQRRNFTAKYQAANGDMSAGLRIEVNYSKYGKVASSATLDCSSSSTGYAPIFLIGGQVLRVGSNNYKLDPTPALEYGKASDDSSSTLAVASITAGYYALIPTAPAAKLTLLTSGGTAVASISSATKGQIVGSAYAEGTGAPDGWRDELSNTEFYMQIFKTAVPLFSGSSMATRYRGFPNEFKRLWRQHILSHKMDIENAALFGYGLYTSQDARYTWGMLPFIETQGGKVESFTYAASKYDDFVDFLEEFFAPEDGNSGDKLVMASRKVIKWFSKLDSGDSFLGNTAVTSGASSLSNMLRLDVKEASGLGNINMTSIRTTFGNLHFVEQPLFRGAAEDIALCVDLANVKYRPLQSNGLSRDTHIITNVQDNDIDGRKDMILTEAGLQIDLPETHALLNFS